MPAYEVKGTVRLADGSVAPGIDVSASDRDLRSEEALGRAITGQDGAYYIQYDASAYADAESGSADLVVKAHGFDGSVLAASPVVFNAPSSAVIDLTIPAEALPPPSRFEAIMRALDPLLGAVSIIGLEEDAEHQDVSFLAGETGLDRTLVARFALANRLAQEDLPAEFWFVLLGGGFYQWTEGATIAEQQAALSRSWSTLDASAVRKALARGIAQLEISSFYQERVPAWVEAFTAFVARQAVSATDTPTFLQSALDHADVQDAAAREAAARVLLAHRELIDEAIAGWEQDHGEPVTTGVVSVPYGVTVASHEEGV
jgi:hypothetical protein